MKITILVYFTVLITIAVGLPPLTKESSSQNDDSYIPGVFILTDSVKKIQDQLKNEKLRMGGAAKVSDQEQGAKLSAIYHKDGKTNDDLTKPRSPILNQALNHGTNEESLTSNPLYTNQNPALNQHKLYLSHSPSEEDRQPTQSQSNLSQNILYTNQQSGNKQYGLIQPNRSVNQYVLYQAANQPSNLQYISNQLPSRQSLNQPIVLNQVPNHQILTNQLPNSQQTQEYILVTQPSNNQVLSNQFFDNQQYLSNQNSNPAQQPNLSQLPFQVLPTQTQALSTNQVPSQGLSHQQVLFVQQPTQSGQPIIFTQHPNLLQNGQLGQPSNLLVTSNQGVNQALWPKPAQNQVYTLVALGQNSNPSANDNYLVALRR